MVSISEKIQLLTSTEGSAKHPKILGQTLDEAWAEIIDDLKPAFDLLRDGKRSVLVEDALLVMDLHGFWEEAYMSYALIPIEGDHRSLSMYGTCALSLPNTILTN